MCFLWAGGFIITLYPGIHLGMVYVLCPTAYVLPPKADYQTMTFIPPFTVIPMSFNSATAFDEVPSSSLPLMFKFQL